MPGIAPPAFRLPATTHPGAVHLLVSDLERSVQYYRQIIGLRVQHTEPETATLGAADDGPALVSLRSRAGVTAARQGALGLYHFAILLPDRAALGRFAAHLAARGERVGMADHLVSEALYLWDPDGLGIEVYADRPRETWRESNGELAMTTDPLDVRALTAAAGATRWDGLPAGTRMGHVHLHVGDLVEAEAFYHRALGLDKMVWSYPGALFLAAGGYHHHLGTNIWARGGRPRPDHARLLHWQLVVPDGGAAAAASLRSAGYSVESTDGGWLTEDPWGTQLRIDPAR